MERISADQSAKPTKRRPQTRFPVRDDNPPSRDVDAAELQPPPAAMDPPRYPPTMPPQMGDASAAYPQTMHHPQMAQQPHHMPMQVPQNPQQQPLAHQVNHGHAAQQPYSAPMPQYSGAENTQSNGNPGPAPSSSINPASRPPPNQTQLQSVSRVDEATGRKYT